MLLPSIGTVQDVGTLRVRLSDVELEEYRKPLFRKELGTAIKFEYHIKETAGASKGSVMFRATTLDDHPLGHAQIHLPRLRGREG
jgi:hypothetical protein